MLEALKKNIKQEKKIIEDMRSIQLNMQNDASNKAFYDSSLNALAEQLMLLNNAVPELLKELSPIKKSGEMGITNQSIKNIKPKKTIGINYISPTTKEKKHITINKEDKEKFLKKLKMSEEALSNIKKMEEKGSGTIIRKPSEYARISNKLFRNYSEKLTPQFDELSKDLKKANIRFLLSSYLSMAIMSTALAFLIGFLFFGVLLFINLNNWRFFMIPFGLAGLAMAAFYLYPSSEANSVQKKISQELPFATIHMAAIAGSNIEPTKIFKIITKSSEYPNIGKEIRKIITQIDIYGYDLVTSLKNVAARTSNKKLSELFSGIATNINTGGALKNYLEKKSEDFLIDYKLERQKYKDLAGTFMDVYISILIAAPLILMMMFIVMNVAGLGMGGLSITTLLILSVVGVVIINIIFIIVLNIKQPKV